MRVLGTTEMKCCQIVVDDLKLPVDAKEFHRRFTVLGDARLGNCNLLPGACLNGFCGLDFFVLLVNAAVL